MMTYQPGQTPGRRHPRRILHRCAMGLTMLLLLAGCSNAFYGLLGAPAVRGVRVEAVELAPSPPQGTARAGAEADPLIRVRLTTPDDLSIYGQQYSSTLWISASLCTEGRLDRRRQLFQRGLFDADGARIWASQGNDPHQRPDGEGRYAYWLQVALRSRAGPIYPPRDDDLYVDHDLRQRADDVCFQFHGGSLLSGHRSESFVIPYPLIAEALARAGLPYAALP